MYSMFCVGFLTITCGFVSKLSKRPAALGGCLSAFDFVDMLPVVVVVVVVVDVFRDVSTVDAGGGGVRLVVVTVAVAVAVVVTAPG